MFVCRRRKGDVIEQKLRMICFYKPQKIAVFITARNRFAAEHEYRSDQRGEVQIEIVSKIFQSGFHRKRHINRFWAQKRSENLKIERRRSNLQTCYLTFVRRRSVRVAAC